MSELEPLFGLEFSAQSSHIVSDLYIEVTLKSPDEADFTVCKDVRGTRAAASKRLSVKKLPDAGDVISISKLNNSSHARFAVNLPESQQILIGHLPSDVQITVSLMRNSGITKIETNSQVFRFRNGELAVVARTKKSVSLPSVIKPSKITKPRISLPKLPKIKLVLPNFPKPHKPKIAWNRFAQIVSSLVLLTLFIFVFTPLGLARVTQPSDDTKRIFLTWDTSDISVGNELVGSINYSESTRKLFFVGYVSKIDDNVFTIKNSMQTYEVLNAGIAGRVVMRFDWLW